MKLPTEKKKAVQEDPALLLLYGKPKIGKTTILSALDNCLILDLEDGTKYVDSLSVRVNNFKELQEFTAAMKEEGAPKYKYLAVDTVSSLEDMILPYAAQLYRKTPMSKNWQGTDVRTLPQGSGYLYLRQAFFNTINQLCKLTPYTILIGHLKDTLINKNGEEMSAFEVDLTGKIKSILSSNVDAMGYVYRKDNKNIINFKPSEEVICGNRIEYLEGKEVVISEKTDQGVKVNWDIIYRNK
jgi:hypothetical protein